jgi:hypothetical protein
VGGAARQTVLADWLAGLPSRRLVLLAAAAVLVASLSRAALAFALPWFRDTRIDPLTWLLLGASIAGAVAPAIFSHPGRSQGYFFLTAIPLSALGSALGAARVARSFRPALLVAVGLLGAVGGIAASYAPWWVAGRLRPHDSSQAWDLVFVWATVMGLVLVGGLVAGYALGTHPPEGGRQRRWVNGAAAGAAVAVATAFLVGGATSAARGVVGARAPVEAVVTTQTPNAVTQGQIDVARYIRDHSAVDDIVMTNRHCSVPRAPYHGCDSRRWIVTAFSERQALVEGWTATPRATRIAPNGRDSITVDYWKPDILRLNDGFTTAPTAQAQRRLWDLGVRWIYLENTMPHAATLEPYAVQRFSTADASAWQLLPPSR